MLAANSERSYPTPRAENWRSPPRSHRSIRLNKSIDKVAVTARDSEHVTSRQGLFLVRKAKGMPNIESALAATSAIFRRCPASFRTIRRRCYAAPAMRRRWPIDMSLPVTPDGGHRISAQGDGTGGKAPAPQFGIPVSCRNGDRPEGFVSTQEPSRC
jgi:hypothetical protein